MKLIKFFIAGLIFGFFNEVFFEPAWNYSVALKPFIYKDIPLIAIPGWGIISMICLLLSDSLRRQINKMPCLLSDIICFVLIFAPLEILFKTLKLWEYNYTMQSNNFSIILGYICVSLFISSVARRVRTS